MSRSTAAHEHAKEVLADGQWHDLDKVMWEVRKAVPPHLAIRRAEAQRVTMFLSRHPGMKREDVPPRKRRVSQDTLIRAGASAYARDILANTRYEHAMDDKGGKWVRLRPEEPQPLPKGWKHYRRGPKGPWAGLTKEQLRERRRETSRRASLAFLASRGIEVTEDYESVTQRQERKRREWAALSEEERARIRSERTRKAARTRLIRQGIDPDTFETQAARRAREKAERAKMTPEERYRAHSELSKKGWETRRSRQKEKDE